MKPQSRALARGPSSQRLVDQVSSGSMAIVDLLYRWLSRDSDPRAGAVFVAGLEHAEPEYVERIVKALLDRRDETAWAGLIANYDRVPGKLRDKLFVSADRVRVGVQRAMNGGLTRPRLNAMALLRDWPCPQLSYLLVDALRDEAPAIRESAARTLKQFAVHILAAGYESGANQRSEIVRALRDGLDSFNRHNRIEVVEVALWFAVDLGPFLWDALSDHHVRCGYVVSQHLESWDHPRLAPFLVLALGQAKWRPLAVKLLREWQTLPEITALLRNSQLLDQPDVRRNLRHLQCPPWLITADRDLPQLPPDARAMLPYWITELGLTAEESIRCLERWQAAGFAELHRTAVYALAAMQQPEALRALTRISNKPCAMARFARWYVAGAHARNRANRAQEAARSSRARIPARQAR